MTYSRGESSPDLPYQSRSHNVFTPSISVTPMRFRACLSCWFCDRMLTSLPAHRNRVASILIIAAGTMYYTWVKSVETAPPPPRAPPADDVEASAAALLNDMDDHDQVIDMQEKKATPP